MSKPRIRGPHTSRRAPPLKDSDYDHEIALVEEYTPPESSASPGLADPGLGPSSSSPDPPLAAAARRRSSSSRRPQSSNGDRPSWPRPNRQDAAGARAGPAIAVEQPTPFEPAVATPAPPEGTGGSQEVESAIDILYENERGALCCGRPLFASRALGSLDPPAWTNVAHKPSPTNIKTAQVPDPSWGWAWPEWRVNHEEQGTDKDGWEYSFAFHKKFSWHGPKWWNSFVRRRAWTRRRVKKDQIRQAHSGSLLQPEYFTVRSSAEMARLSSAELSGHGSGSKRGSILSASADSHATEGAAGEQLDIRDVEELLVALRACRIDREKIEALENYFENGDEDDLANLEGKMAEVMGFFIFQTSRRLLMARLTELHDQTQAEAAKQAESGTGGPSRTATMESALAAALRRADEEVKRLEYWSDVKEVAEKGLSHGAVDGECGWDDSWEGVDNSGPAAPSSPGKGAK